MTFYKLVSMVVYFPPLGRHEVNLPHPVLQKMKKLLIMKHPSDSNLPEGRNNQDLKK